MGIAVELANAFRQLFRGHRVLVVQPAKGLFLQEQSLFFALSCLHLIEFALHSTFRVFELIQKFRADGEQIAPCQTDDLVHIPEACSHHLRLVTEFLVVIVNARHGCNTRILVGSYLCSTVLFPVPIGNPAYEGRDESDARLGASHRLGKAEQKRQVAVDALHFKDLRCPDSFPGARSLDQNSIPRKTFLFVERNELSPLGNSTGRIETQAGWNLGGNPAEYYFENFRAEQHEESIDKLFSHALLSVAHLRSYFGCFFDQMTISRHLRGLEKKRGICRRILWTILRNRLNVAGVGYYSGVLSQGLK